MPGNAQGRNLPETFGCIGTLIKHVLNCGVEEGFMSGSSARISLILLAAFIGISIYVAGSGPAPAIPAAATDEPLAKKPGQQTAVVAGAVSGASRPCFSM